MDYTVAQQLYVIEEKKARKLAKPMGAKGFNGARADDILEYVNMEMSMGNHWDPCCRFKVTDLGEPKIIIGKRWLKTHGAICNAITEKVYFVGGHCSHEGASAPTPFDLGESMEGAPRLTLDEVIPEQDQPEDAKTKKSYRGSGALCDELDRKYTEKVNLQAEADRSKVAEAQISIVNARVFKALAI